jgi:hypothetical protein
MKIAYFDCFAGADGNMILGAMVDAVRDPDLLNMDGIVPCCDRVCREIPLHDENDSTQSGDTHEPTLF